MRPYEVSSTPGGTFLTDVPLIGTSLSKITAVVYDPDNDILYVGDDIPGAIYTINTTGSIGTLTFVDSAPVSGGDVAILNSGDIYLATRLGNELRRIAPPYTSGSTVVANIGPYVTGMARANDNSSLILSHKGAGVFTKVDTDNLSNPVKTYNVMLDNLPFTLSNGDMAAGCADEVTPEPPVNPFIAVVSNSTLVSYPNPTKGPSKVVFTTGQTTKTLVEVYDMNGRNVGTLFNQEAQKGEQYTLDFNGSTLSNGVYIYRMTTEKETIIEKFMIAK